MYDTADKRSEEEEIFVFSCLCVSHSEEISRKFYVAEDEGRRQARDWIFLSIKLLKIDFWVNDLRNQSPEMQNVEINIERC
jgi:hypothetical protein